MCVEINAHSLLATIFILPDEMKANSKCFLPWMLGSQSCERVFRSLRSMTGTFSTVVNFSLVGMLQRLHKLYIQEECQSKTRGATVAFAFQDERNMGLGTRYQPLCIAQEFEHPNQIARVTCINRKKKFSFNN